MKSVKVDGKQHYEVETYPENCDESLKEVTLSNKSISETSSMRLVQITFPFGMRDTAIFVGDSPGFNDTRGPEIDLVNQYGLFEVARECKGVVPILVINQ